MKFRYCDDLGEHGLSWLAEEPMTRTSHALAAAGKVWLVDPVDWPEALERASLLGRPAAVIQLIDRHNRDAAVIAARLGIPRLVVPPALPGTPFDVVGVMRRPWWREVALWWPEQRTLVVAEALGSNAYFTVRDDDVGVHGLLRLVPPRSALGGFQPEHLLLGHGEGLHGARATTAVRQALSRSRLSVVRWGLGLPKRARRAS